MSSSAAITHEALANADCRALPIARQCLSTPELLALQQALPAWEIQTSDNRNGSTAQLSRRCAFADLASAMRFANAVATMADAQDHHPELHLSWGLCVVSWSTHSAHGLTQRDFICAAKVDGLLHASQRT
jgi:4a-hydroxytetrahydrobiopterin dehydratase